MAFYARRKLIEQQRGDTVDLAQSFPGHRFGVCQGVTLPFSKASRRHPGGKIMQTSDSESCIKRPYSHKAPFASLTIPQAGRMHGNSQLSCRCCCCSARPTAWLTYQGEASLELRFLKTLSSCLQLLMNGRSRLQQRSRTRQVSLRGELPWATSLQAPQLGVL